MDHVSIDRLVEKKIGTCCLLFAQLIIFCPLLGQFCQSSILQKKNSWEGQFHSTLEFSVLAIFLKIWLGNIFELLWGHFKRPICWMPSHDRYKWFPIFWGKMKTKTGAFEKSLAPSPTVIPVDVQSVIDNHLWVLMIRFNGNTVVKSWSHALKYLSFCHKCS